MIAAGIAGTVPAQASTGFTPVEVYANYVIVGLTTTLSFMAMALCLMGRALETLNTITVIHFMQVGDPGRDFGNITDHSG